MVKQLYEHFNEYKRLITADSDSYMIICTDIEYCFVDKKWLNTQMR